MVSSSSRVDPERLDYALRRRSPSFGVATWDAGTALSALAYASCQHMTGQRRVDAQRALEEAACLALQEQLWPGNSLWSRHAHRVAVRRWGEEEALPELGTRGSFETRGKQLAALVLGRLVSAPPLEQLDDGSLRTCSLDDD